MNRRRVKNISRKGRLLQSGLFVYLILCLFAIISLRTTVFNLEYELGELDRLRADLNIERKMIAAERANFYSTAKIQKVALKRLGMTFPGRDNLFFVKNIADAGPYRASLKRDY